MKLNVYNKIINTNYFKFEFLKNNYNSQITESEFGSKKGTID